MDIFDIKHEVMRGRMSAQEAYELVKPYANRPFVITKYQLEEFRLAALAENEWYKKAKEAGLRRKDLID